MRTGRLWLMFVAISRFAVANGMEAEVKAAFTARPHHVEAEPGFVRLDVLSPFDDSAEIWLVTFWESEEAFRGWHRSHKFRDSHRGIPKGLKLIPQETELRFFEHICS